MLVHCAGMQGRTALHIAVIHGHSNCVGILLAWNEEQGLPVNTLEIADDHVSFCCYSDVGLRPALPRCFMSLLLLQCRHPPTFPPIFDYLCCIALCFFLL